MRNFRGAVNLGLALGFACVITLGVLIAASEPPPPWAYGFTTPPGEQASAPPAAAPVKDDGTLRHLNGSTLAFTLTQIRDNGGPADWYPGDHPAMPPIVARGRKEAAVCMQPLPLSKRQGSAGKCRRRGSANELFHPDHE